MDEFAIEWKRYSANRRLSAERVGRFGSYVIPIYRDLHHRVGDDPVAPWPKTWRLYAIELADDAGNDPKLKNSTRDPGKPL